MFKTIKNIFRNSDIADCIPDYDGITATQSGMNKFKRLMKRIKNEKDLNSNQDKKDNKD